MTKYWLLYLFAAFLLGQAVRGLLTEQERTLREQIEVAKRIGWHDGFGRGVAVSGEMERTSKEKISLDF